MRWRKLAVKCPVKPGGIWARAVFLLQRAGGLDGAVRCGDQ